MKRFLSLSLFFLILLLAFNALADVAGTLKISPKTDGKLCTWSAALPGLACNTTDDDVPEAGDYSNLTGGTGITNNPTGTINTASGEVDFLASGSLTCGAGTQGKMQVHTTPLQYCDNSATPTLRYSAYGDSSGNANTANALTSNPSDCSAGQYATTIAASGNLTCAQVTGAQVSNTPAGNIAADDVQEAINELDSEKLATGGNAATATALASNPSDCSANQYATTIAASGNLTCAQVTVAQVDMGGQKLADLRPQANEPPASSFATMNTRNSHPTLRFNGNVCAVWSFVMPDTYQGNGVTVEIWEASTETSNDTDWDGSWERIATAQDTDSDSFATAVSADNNNNSGTSGIPTKVSIAFTNGAQMDSCAAGELCRFKLCRDDTSDTGGADTIDYLGGQIKETP